MNNAAGGNRVCVFGEVLFDEFPDGAKVLGGAPFNVAWNLQALGEAPVLVSGVGNDERGDEVIAAMQQWGMSLEAMQRDSKRPTGRVTVAFENGEPAYEIQQNCAYDAISKPSIDPCRLLYHGTLALRSAPSAVTLDSLRDEHDGLVFVDVNLRSPWWQADSVESLLGHAHWVKLNEQELHLLAAESGQLDAVMESFAARYGLQGLVVTCGEQGARALTPDGGLLTVRPQDNVVVTDTVGAGDAFSAVCLIGLLHAWPLHTTLQRAQSFAARVVGQRGATTRSRAFYEAARLGWEQGG
tara:strand:- start:123332 stop:124225 length:894 start_codon:yes stop_codon:yes gene_type:complete